MDVTRFLLFNLGSAPFWNMVIVQVKCIKIWTAGSWHWYTEGGQSYVLWAWHGLHVPILTSSARIINIFAFTRIITPKLCQELGPENSGQVKAFIKNSPQCPCWVLADLASLCEITLVWHKAHIDKLSWKVMLDPTDLLCLLTAITMAHKENF